MSYASDGGYEFVFWMLVWFQICFTAGSLVIQNYMIGVSVLKSEACWVHALCALAVVMLFVTAPIEWGTHFKLALYVIGFEVLYWFVRSQTQKPLILRGVQ